MRGVSLIASQWEIAWRDPAVESVDVTAKLVEHFKPNAQVRKWLEDMKTRQPMPLVEIAQMPLHE